MDDGWKWSEAVRLVCRGGSLAPLFLIIKKSVFFTSPPLIPRSLHVRSNRRATAFFISPHIMRLQSSVLLFVAYLSATARAIFPDEVDHLDFHHALLGIPSTRPHSDSTFFHRPIPSSGASLLYTLSEKLILGAVNPKDGFVVWRQNISRYAFGEDGDPDAGALGFLRASNQSRNIVSAVDGYVSAWNAFDGKLVWENRFTHGGPVRDLELLELHDPSAAPWTSDVVAVFGDENGAGVSTVRRIDGGTGEVQWEFIDRRYAYTPRSLLLLEVTS